MNVPDSNEAPPPPYSETDIYSNAGSGSRSSEGRTPATSQATPSVAGESTASRSHPPTSIGSSQSDLVYTPPLTPRTGNTNDSFLPPSSSAPAAEAYFESRPTPPNGFPGPILAHTVKVSLSSRPDDFPFPEAWAARDVLPADWQTFLNFLLPAHTVTSNDEVLSRKLRAEEESLASGTTSGPASSSGRTHASTQLEHLRTSNSDTATPTAASVAEARREATCVTSEWNQGFFLPRHLNVHLVLDSTVPGQENQRPQMPGAWDSGSDHNTPQHRPQGQYQPPPHPPPPLVGPPQQFPWGPNYQQQPRPGFSFAGIRMNDDGLYIGNSLAADRNGLRLGGLVADTNGLRYRDNVVVGPGMFSGGPNPEYPGTQYLPPAHPPPPMGPQPGFSPQAGISPGGFPPAQSPFHDSSPGRPNLSRGPSGSHPHLHPPGPPRRSRSGSSVSSKSSATSSTSSLGSLPDYDELEAAQIPVYRSTLQSWLIAPERQVTKQDVQRLRAELREAKRKEVEYPQGNIDKRALKAEIKSLKHEWRTLRRAQRSVRREAKRQRRTQRRQEKRERRNSRQAQKQAERHPQHGRGGSWSLPGGLPPGIGRGIPGPGVHPPRGLPPFGPGPWGGGPPPGAPPFGFAPGFGQGFGLGRGHGPPFLPHPPMPGSWGPDDSQGDVQNQGPGASMRQGQQASPQRQSPQTEAGPAKKPHEASQAKFKQLDEMEKELARKMDQMCETTREDTEEKNKKETGEKVEKEVGQPSGEASGASLRELETEVDELLKKVEKLKMEADETFARELEEEERRQAGVR